MRDAFTTALKDAMKAGDKRRISTIRLITAALKDRDIEARGVGKGPLGDDEILGLLQKMVKQRQESLKIYEENARPELAEQEREEIAIIMGFMPQQMSEAEVAAAIDAVVAETGAAGMKDMGKVMAALKERYSGRMDFGKASAAIKARLAS
ncbi:MAG: GatB/YqeY domain-containing protein [Alsobacter sp.]